jgi:hypothetical protein
VSDELLRRFRDKIQGRPAGRRRVSGSAPEETLGDPVEDLIRIRALEHGPFPAATRYNPRFLPGVGRIRLTVDLGARIRQRPLPVGAYERDRLLALCPRLLSHDCAGNGGQGMGDLLAPVTGATPARPGDDGATADGLPVAHLIEHVAIDLMVAASGATRCSGATCAYRDRWDRFDIFLESDDAALGSAVAILAAVAVRDLFSGGDRLAIHARCRDLLALIASTGRKSLAPEDVASALEWNLAGARETLEAAVRLGYLDAVPAPFTFSSATGLIFRRAASGRDISGPGPDA